MKKLLSSFNQKKYLGYALIFTVFTLLVVSCQKNEDFLKLNNNTELISQNLQSSSNFDDHSELIYKHLKNFQATMKIGNYSANTQSQDYFNNKFLQDVELLKQNYPTLDALLTYYVKEKFITEETKSIWLTVDSESTAFFKQQNLNYPQVEEFLSIQAAKVENAGIIDKEKQYILYSISAMNGFFKYYFEKTALQRNGANTRSMDPCDKSTWPCIIEFGYYTAAGAKFGSVFPGAGTAVGAFIGGIYGSYKMSKCIEDLQKKCDEHLQKEKCKNATNLSLQIEGCGLTQKIIATGQGSGVNSFVWNNQNATPPVSITTIPLQVVTQIDPNAPVAVALNTSCDGSGSGALTQSFNIANLVGDVGNIQIAGPHIVCKGYTECFSAIGSTFNNPNNTFTFDANGLNASYQDGVMCITFPNQVGNHSISVTATNACTGATTTHTMQISVKATGCQL